MLRLNLNASYWCSLYLRKTTFACQYDVLFSYLSSHTLDLLFWHACPCVLWRLTKFFFMKYGRSCKGSQKMSRYRVVQTDTSTWVNSEVQFFSELLYVGKLKQWRKYIHTFVESRWQNTGFKIGHDFFLYDLNSLSNCNTRKLWQLINSAQSFSVLEFTLVSAIVRYKSTLNKNLLFMRMTSLEDYGKNCFILMADFSQTGVLMSLSLCFTHFLPCYHSGSFLSIQSESQEQPALML